MESRNGLSAWEANAKDFEVEPRFLSFRDEARFAAARRKGGGKGRQYLANFFGPKRETAEAIQLIYFAIQVTHSKKVEGSEGVEKIFEAGRTAPTQLAIDPA